MLDPSGTLKKDIFYSNWPFDFRKISWGLKKKKKKKKRCQSFCQSFFCQTDLDPPPDENSWIHAWPACSKVKTIYPEVPWTTWCTIARGREVIVRLYYKQAWNNVLLPNPFDEILNCAFLEWSCCRRCGFVAKQKISPNLLNFGLKMFRSNKENEYPHFVFLTINNGVIEV